MKNLKEIKLMMERLESPRMTQTEVDKKKKEILNETNIGKVGLIKEDYLELKSIGKQLYSFLKKEGYNVTIKEDSSKSTFSGGDKLVDSNEGGKGGIVQIKQFSDVEQIGVSIPSYAVTYQFLNNQGNYDKIKKVYADNRQDFGPEQKEKFLNDGDTWFKSSLTDSWDGIAKTVFKSKGCEDLSQHPEIIKSVNELGNKLSDIVKSKIPNMEFVFDNQVSNCQFVMYFREPKTKKGGYTK